MVSPLSPQQFGQAPNFGQQLLGAVAQGQGIQANNQALRAGEQQMALRQQGADQQMSEIEYRDGVRKLTLLRNLASNARKLPPNQRQQYVMSAAPALESFGYSVEQIAQQPLDDAALDQYVSQLNAAIPQDSTTVRVQSSQVLDDGTTVQVLTDGSTRVTDPNGRVVEGDQRAQAIRNAQQFGVDIQSQRAGGRAGAVLDTRIDKEPRLQDLTTRATKEAENVTKTSKEYFDQLQNIEGNIRNYAEGIRLIREEGANSGVIARRLPSLTAASQKLDNLRNRLGLDVVGGTTFGALSEAELAMALDTAMPNNLQPEQLAKWFEDRMTAQQKLADILDGAVQFLNVPGNSLADLRAMQKQQRTTGGSGHGAATPGIAPPSNSQQRIQQLRQELGL
jgi:hypothetical protein